jgi:hypothetical protein
MRSLGCQSRSSTSAMGQLPAMSILPYVELLRKDN